MTEIVFFRNNKKKKNKKKYHIAYLFPTPFLVHRKVRCPPKVPPKPTSIHIYISSERHTTSDLKKYPSPVFAYPSISKFSVSWTSTQNYQGSLKLWLCVNWLLYTYSFMIDI